MFESSLLKNIDTVFDEIISLKVKVENLNKNLNNYLNNQKELPINKEELLIQSFKLNSIDLTMVPDEFLENKEVIKIAIDNDIKNINYPSPEFIFNNSDIVSDILSKDGLKLEYMPNYIKENKNFCTIAINENYNSFKFSKCQEIINDKNLVNKIVDKDGLLLEFSSSELKKDFEIAITAITNNRQAEKFISKEIRENIISLFS